MEHDFVSPAKFSIALVTRQFTVRWRSIPIHSSNKSVPQMELIINFPFFHSFRPEIIIIHTVFFLFLSFTPIVFLDSFAFSLFLLLFLVVIEVGGVGPYHEFWILLGSS